VPRSNGGSYETAHFVGARPTLLRLLLSPALADPIAIDFTARVTSTIDYGGFLGPVVNVGDIITGRYVYESTTPDANHLSAVGDYRHNEVPFGITLDVNGLVFRTDPAAVDFLVELGDNHRGSGDFYLLRSYNNIFAVSVPSAEIRAVDNHILWYLQDFTGAAQNSPALPELPPMLAAWPIRNLQITSDNYGFVENGYFAINAEITSVTAAAPVPNPPRSFCSAPASSACGRGGSGAGSGECPRV